MSNTFNKNVEVMNSLKETEEYIVNALSQIEKEMYDINNDLMRTQNRLVELRNSKEKLEDKLKTLYGYVPKG